jgi:hypothetical protein
MLQLPHTLSLASGSRQTLCVLFQQQLQVVTRDMHLQLAVFRNRQLLLLTLTHPQASGSGCCCFTIILPVTYPVMLIPSNALARYCCIMKMHAQTEVLAAARAALGTTAVTSGDANISSSSRAGGTATLEQPSAYPPTGITSPPQQPGGVPSSSSPAASTSGSSDGYGGGSSSPAGSSDAAGEPLTRRWSPLSEDQDLTRHVLQNALDQMQKSGAPIAAPKEEPPVEPTPSSSRSSTPSSSSVTTRPPSSSGSGSGGASGGGSSSSGSSRRSRDIRSSGRGGGLVMEDGHGPAPSWAQSLLGE